VKRWPATTRYSHVFMTRADKPFITRFLFGSVVIDDSA